MKISGQIILRAGRESSTQKCHPWLFSGAIAEKRGEVSEGALVEVISAGGEYLGSGYYSEGSIAVRFLSFAPLRLSDNWLNELFQSAIAQRRTLGLFESSTTNAFRLVNAEGDSLPGLVVDVYSHTLVIQTHHAFMTVRAQDICHELREALGDRVECVIHRAQTGGGAQDATQILWGDVPTDNILENGLNYRIDVLSGHKTGFYLDQRENRQLLRECATDRIVLNAFSYSGGFSISALAGGAKSVVSVDSSKGALELLEANVTLNGFSERHQIVSEDYLAYMKTVGDAQFDLVVLDPPAFVKHRGALKGGLTGYRSINANALNRIAHRGLLFTFSCSQFVSRELFREIVMSAAAQAKRRVRILRQLSAAPCHPTSLFHPEGEYLKGLLLYVEGPVGK